MATKIKEEKSEQKFITAEELDAKLDKFGDKVLAVIEALEKKIEVPAKTIEAEAVIAKAGPNKFTVNEEWDQEAKSIIGEAVDHTEVIHERNGGIKFTVIVKKEFSNAGNIYLDLVGTDRRTKEVGSEGIGGVIEWCKLIKQNLARPSAANQRNI